MMETIFISAPADTEKRIHLENLLDEAGPGCPASLNVLRGGIGRCARACRRRGLLLARGPLLVRRMLSAKRRARHVTREPLKLPGILRRERLSGENRKPGMDP